MQEERRKITRIDHRRIVVIGREPLEDVPGEMRDASDCGIGLVTTKAFASGDRVRVTVPFAPNSATGRQFVLAGTVIRCAPEPDLPGRHRVGLALDELPMQEKQAWHDLIQRVRAFVV